MCVCGVGGGSEFYPKAFYKDPSNKEIPVSIAKTRLYNFDPIESHFYIVKLGFTGVHIIFLVFLKKMYIVGTR